VDAVLAGLDQGELRVAEPARRPGGGLGGPRLGEEAILLYFAMRPTEASKWGPFIFATRSLSSETRRRRGFAWSPRPRFGTLFLERGVVAMPCYVNIGRVSGQGP